MKKTIIAITILTILFSMAIPSSAQEDGPLTKLNRGVMNICDAVVEIPGSIVRETQKNGFYSGITKGTLTGVVAMPIRTLVGVFEVATFPVAIPRDYKPIMPEPQFLSAD